MEVDLVVASHVISMEQRFDGSQRLRQHRLAHMHENPDPHSTAIKNSSEVWSFDLDAIVLSRIDLHLWSSM